MGKSKDSPGTETIESPCVRNCCLDDKDICLGCGRTLEEITRWTIVDNETRQQFLANIAARKSKETSMIVNCHFL